MSRVVRFARWAAIIALAVGYALIAHYTNTTVQTETLGTMLALAPLVLAALLMAWHARNRTAALALFAIGCTALITTWATLEQNFSRIYWIEHAGTQLILCLTFGRTLTGGREPLCTYFARMVHGSLTPVLAHYTRQVTAAWVAFFGLMTAVSTTLFFNASIETWSMFANFFTAPLIGGMFVAEYLVRRSLHPDMEHAHILDAVKAFWKMPAR